VPDKPETDGGSSDPAPARGLTPVERWVASLVGLVGIGVGGVGIFLSDNQAGTTAILLLGAVFLLMGVQGTAIIKAGKDSVELDRRLAVRRVIEKAEERVENNPDEAAGLVEAAWEVFPSLAHDVNLQNLSADIYEQQALRALERAVFALDRQRSHDDPFQATMSTRPRPHYRTRRPDAVIRYRASASGPDRILVVEIKKASGHNLPDGSVREALELFKEVGENGLIISNLTPGLVLNNYRHGDYADVRFDFVQWRDERDDSELVETLKKLLSTSA
jgi:hypothetical protein